MPRPSPQEFRAAYERHRDDVWRYVARRAGPDVADDVTGDVFATAWRRWGDVPDAVLPWLYGVARRTLANHRRAERRRRALLDRLADRTPRGPRPVEPAADPRLAAAFAALPPADRELIALVAWEGLSPAQLAVALGCREGTARVRLHRARARLARALRPDDPPHPSPTAELAR